MSERAGTRQATQVVGGLDVEAIRRDFPILSRTVGEHPLVYLDSAATSHKPNQVIDAEAEFYRRHNANAHRGLYLLGEEATQAYEGARATVARFLGAPDAETIVFTRGVTESMNLVAQGWGRAHLGAGDEILITEMEHHSNIVPWQMTAAVTGATLRYIPLTDDGLLDLSALGSLLTERTKIAERHGHVQRARHHHAPAAARRRRTRGRGDRRRRRGPARAAFGDRRAGARRRPARLHRPQDARPHRERRPLRQGRGARGDAADARGRRDDRRGLPRSQHLQVGALQVRGRHDADRPAGGPRCRDRLLGSARHGERASPRGRDHALCPRSPARRRRHGVRPEGRQHPRRRRELLVQGRASARSRDRSSTSRAWRSGPGTTARSS